MSVAERPASPRVEARRGRTREEILQAAWALAAESGLESLSLRELANRVGMRAPSLYSYYPSKASILDAMFADGYRAFDRDLEESQGGLPDSAGAQERLARLLLTWIEFCQASPARYRLMFTAAVPGWSPSAEAYAVSQANFARAAAAMARAGVTEPAGIDLCTAVAAGLVAQQMANDPGGDRWVRLVDDAVAMVLHHLRPDPGPHEERRP